jgi:ABC-type nitrate/sulfonate/bicarbonate transport system permease component
MAGMVVIGALGLLFSQLVALVRRMAVPYTARDAW